MSSLLRRIFLALRGVERRVQRRRRASAAVGLFRTIPAPYKLHFGCGTVSHDGWVNIDLNGGLPNVNLTWDVRHGLPLPDECCALIYHEHLLEHLTVPEADRFLGESYRLLRRDGVLRVAMPSLSNLVAKYQAPDWRDQDWLRQPEYDFIETPAEMLNVAVRWWGHEWLYDREELHRRLRKAGFTRVEDVDWGESDIPTLRNLETRPDSFLICEARK